MNNGFNLLFGPPQKKTQQMEIPVNDPEIHFDGKYEHWRETRITKLITILGGNEWFAGKEVLELACGAGHTGRRLAELGANVTFCEGRQANIDYAKEKYGTNIELLNQDTDWSLGDRKFDLIIHWGVLYHLDDWLRDLSCVQKHGNFICLESEVVDTNDITAQIKITENPDWWDQSVSGTATKPPVAGIEHSFLSAGYTFVRYDDADLNSSIHTYDWIASNSNRCKAGQRRFWIFSKNDR
jgi:cyclopropane fatty-acyl-phospholipid synthase-like methyltransferase